MIEIRNDIAANAAINASRFLYRQAAEATSMPFVWYVRSNEDARIFWQLQYKNVGTTPIGSCHNL